MSLERLLSFDYNNQPAGVLQANRVEGFTTRPVSQAISSVDVSQFAVPLVFGTSAGTPGAANGVEWSSPTTITGPINSVKDIYLSEIQFKTVQGVTSGDGFCKIRLKSAEKEIIESSIVSNVPGMNNGLVVLLDSNTGVVRFDPPRHVKHYKNQDGTFNANSTFAVGLLDDAGNPRGFQKLILNFIFTTKYYQ